MNIPQQFRDAAGRTQKQKKPVQTTVRDILSWYGYSQRGSWIVEQVKDHAKQLGLVIFPNFAGAYINAPVFIARRESVTILDEEDNTAPAPSIDGADPIIVEKAVSETFDGDMHQISRLRAANTSPLCVTPNDRVEQAVTLMRMYNYSQLPVTTGQRDVKGIITWKSIGERLAQGIQCTEVRECMVDSADVKMTDSIFDVIRKVSEHDCVLIRDRDRTLKGLVTAADISEHFQSLTEPFIVFGVIENLLRRLIERANFGVETLRAARDPGDSDRSVNAIEDLTFGEYRRLLEKDENWRKLGLKIDRAIVVKELERMRTIRNDVMHFDPDGIDVEKLRAIRQFARFLDGVLKE